jgi:uncharacterized protein YggE
MLKPTLTIVFAMSASLLFGQLESNSITVTASQSNNVQPDQVLFAVYVSSGINTSLDDVLAALKPSGIVMANFSGVANNNTVAVTGSQPQQPMLQWAFGLPVPFAQMKATVAALTSLQQGIAQANSGLTLSFSVQGTQVSAALQQSQTCNIPSLLGAATTQAQALASAGGLTLGSILAMSGNTASPSASPAPESVFQSGTFVSALLTVPQNCALTVRFAATRF